MKNNNANKYICIEEIEVIEMKETLQDAEVEEMKKRVLENMENKQEKRAGKGARVAVAAALCALVIPAGVYAADKLNLFGKLFGGADETPLAGYVEYAQEEKVYVDSNGAYEVAANYSFTNHANSSGVLCFTITDLTGEGKQWYEVATIDDWYADWEMEAKELPEIYAGEKEGNLSFKVNGLGQDDYRVFLKEEESDANKKVCMLIFNDFKKENIEDANLSLVVRERHGEAANRVEEKILEVDIPVGETIPALTWTDENGAVVANLSSFDYFVAGVKDGGQDVWVVLKDGSEYLIQKDDKKVMNEIYGTLSDDGIWGSFHTVLDLEEVEAFYFDDVKYSAQDAILK